MPRYDNSDRLRHMRDSAKKAVEFCADRTRTDLDEDEKLVLALARLLEIIGEAANKISPDFRDQHLAIDWQPIIAARNRLIHGYADVDLDIVWNIVTENLPTLISKLEKILPTETG